MSFQHFGAGLHSAFKLSVAKSLPLMWTKLLHMVCVTSDMVVVLDASLMLIFVESMSLLQYRLLCSTCSYHMDNLQN